MTPGMTVFGASRPLPRVAATVCFLITERALSLGGGNGSSRPKPDLIDERSNPGGRGESDHDRDRLPNRPLTNTGEPSCDCIPREPAPVPAATPVVTLEGLGERHDEAGTRAAEDRTVA